MIDRLLKQLKAAQDFERCSAATELGSYYCDSRIVKPLIKALDDPEARVRAAAAHSLGRTGRVPDVAAVAREALNKLSILLEDNKEEEVVASVIYAIGELGDYSMGSRLLPFLNYPNLRHVKTRNITIAALAALRYKPALPHFYRLLDDSDPSVRHDTMFVLVELRKHFEIDAEEILGRLLKDPNPLIRNNAKDMLEIVRDEQT